VLQNKYVAQTKKETSSDAKLMYAIAEEEIDEEESLANGPRKDQPTFVVS